MANLVDLMKTISDERDRYAESLKRWQQGMFNIAAIDETGFRRDQTPEVIASIERIIAELNATLEWLDTQKEREK